ncbi:MAG TPA: BatD family protein [Rhodocyclaceae bacterium]|nr:BatD family protein [Rhodocyclaceae bacterium]
MVKGLFKRILFLLIATSSVFSSVQAMAALQAHVDRNPVTADESFTLVLQSDGSNRADPDLSPLQQDFDILGQSKSSNIQITNGQSTQSTQWQISLSAKRVGQLVIPAITAGGQSSQPITLKVVAASQAPAAQQQGDLFLDVEAEPHVAYVQQQILFTVRLYRAVNLADGSTLSDPVFPNMDAVVQRLGDDREFQTERNGVAYAVVERRYAVYPQKSGSFASAPLVFDGNVIEENQGGGFFSFDPFNQRIRHQRVRSKTISFSVKPIPAGFSGNQWLPASKLSLSEQWSENPPKFTAGEPVTRTLTIQAGGLTASVLPAIDNSNSGGFKLYPDQPALKDNKNDNGITGVREQKFALIPTHAGNLSLPSIEVKWWNTTTDKQEVASLPARNITVLAGAQNANAAPPVTNTSPGSPLTEAPADQSANTPLPSGRSQFVASYAWWPWLALLLAVGWSMTSIAWWRARRNASRHDLQREESERKPNEENLKQLEQLLKKSCLADDAMQVKSQLLAWAGQRWPGHAPNSLTALARRCDPGLAEEIVKLDQALYAKASSSWKGDTLWQIFIEHKPVVNSKHSEHDVALEPLYKNQNLELTK